MRLLYERIIEYAVIALKWKSVTGMSDKPPLASKKVRCQVEVCKQFREDSYMAC